MTAERASSARGRPLSFLPVPRQDVPDAGLWARLSELRALLVISLLMTESVDEDQILELAASSAPGSPTAGGARAAAVRRRRAACSRSSPRSAAAAARSTCPARRGRAPTR